MFSFSKNYAKINMEMGRLGHSTCKTRHSTCKTWHSTCKTVEKNLSIKKLVIIMLTYVLFLRSFSGGGCVWGLGGGNGDWVGYGMLAGVGGRI